MAESAWSFVEQGVSVVRLVVSLAGLAISIRLSRLYRRVAVATGDQNGWLRRALLAHAGVFMAVAATLVYLSLANFLRVLYGEDAIIIWRQGAVLFYGAMVAASWWLYRQLNRP